MRSNLLLACILAWVQMAAIAQDTLTRDNIGTWQPTWRFSPGDSATWSNPALDDSDWDSVETSIFDPGMVDSTGWRGVGWFRAHFVVDSLAAGIPIGYTASLGGAAEIYLDGELIQQVGQPAAMADEEQAVRFPDDHPVLALMPAMTPGSHTLAVRVSNFFLSAEGETPFGLRLRFGEPTALRAQHAEVSKVASALRYLLTGIAGVLCIIYILLFGFQPKHIGNLLFGLLSGLAAVVIFADLHSRTVSDATVYVSWRRYMELAGVAGWVVGVRLVGQSFFKEIWKLFPALAVLAGLVAVYVYFDPIGGFWSLQVLGIVASAEILRRVGLAAFLSRPGSWLVLFGSILFVVGAIYDYLCHLEVIDPVFGISNLLHVGLVAFLTLMALFMAVDFARTNRSLEFKIVQLGRDAKKAIQEEKINQSLRIDRIQAELESRRKEFEVEKSREVDSIRKSLVVNREILKATEDKLINAEKLASLGRLSAGIAKVVDDVLERINTLTNSTIDLTSELDEFVEGSAKEAESNELIGQIRKNLDRIAEQETRAKSIIDDILQHGAGSTDAVETVELNELIDRYLNLSLHSARGEFPRLDLVVERTLDENTGSINVPSAHLGRALMSVFRNAIEALAALTNEGEDFQPTLTVSSQRLDNAVLVRVRDNGPGVDQELRDRIFEPFFSTKSDNAGLGLSIAHKIIVDDLKGTFGLEHFKEQGAGFYITIPLVPASETEAEEEAEPEAPDASP